MLTQFGHWRKSLNVPHFITRLIFQAIYQTVPSSEGARFDEPRQAPAAITLNSRDRWFAGLADSEADDLLMPAVELITGTGDIGPPER